MTHDRLKVAFVINGLGTGGAERSLRELLPHLRAHAIDIHIFALHPRDEGVQEQVIQGGFRVDFLRGGSFALWIRDLRSRLRHLQPDIVHTTLFESDVVGRLAAWGLPCKVVTSLVNISYDDDRLQDARVRRARLRVVQAIDAVTARRLCDHFHAITHAVERASIRHLGISPDRVTVVPRGRDGARLGLPSPARRIQARERLGLPPDAPILVNVGRQEFQKGQVHLLTALAALAQSHPSVILLQAGRRGRESDALDALARQPLLRERVQFLGHREDVPGILAAADVFVFPSLYEGLGGALIEAMALGLPIVASDVPAIREVVENHGNAELVRPGSPAHLAGAIGRLLDDPQLRDRYGQRSREIFESRFTLDRSAQGMIRLYRQLLT